VRLHCVLGSMPDCEFYERGYCKLDHIIAEVPLATKVPVCTMRKARTRECSICRAMVSTWHMEGTNGILCEACYKVLYINPPGVATTDLEIRREALKDLVARVRKDEHSKCPSEEVLKLRRQDAGTHA